MTSEEDTGLKRISRSLQGVFGRIWGESDDITKVKEDESSDSSEDSEEEGEYSSSSSTSSSSSEEGKSGGEEEGEISSGEEEGEISSGDGEESGDAEENGNEEEFVKKAGIRKENGNGKVIKRKVNGVSRKLNGKDSKRNFKYKSYSMDNIRRIKGKDKVGNNKQTRPHYNNLNYRAEEEWYYDENHRIYRKETRKRKKNIHRKNRRKINYYMRENKPISSFPSKYPAYHEKSNDISRSKTSIKPYEKGYSSTNDYYSYNSGYEDVGSVHQDGEYIAGEGNYHGNISNFDTFEANPTIPSFENSIQSHPPPKPSNKESPYNDQDYEKKSSKSFYKSHLNTFPYGFTTKEVEFLYNLVTEGQKLYLSEKTNRRMFKRLSKVQYVILSDFKNEVYDKVPSPWTTHSKVHLYCSKLLKSEKERLEDLRALVSDHEKRISTSDTKKKIKKGMQFILLRHGGRLKSLKKKKKPRINDVDSLLLHYRDIRNRLYRVSPPEFRDFRNIEAQKSKINRLLGSLKTHLFYYAKEYYDDHNSLDDSVVHGKDFRMKFFGRFNPRGVREGPGVEFHPDGRTVGFEGNFKNGKRDGHGIEYNSKSERVFQGTFSRGTRHGRGIEYNSLKSKTHLKAIWVNGKIDRYDEKFVQLEEVDLGEMTKKCTLEDRLGKGGFGEVYKIRWRGKNYAAKILDCAERDRTHIEKIEACVKLMKSLSHENIIKVYGWSPRGKKIGYITELCKESVYDYIVRKRNRLSLRKRMDLLYFTARGLQYLHRMQIMHRDLKWENILISFDGVLKIIDFEFAKVDESGFRRSFVNNEKLGTNWYVAPEVYLEKSNYTKKCDVYSFGIMIHILLFTDDMFVNPYQYDGRKYCTRCRGCGVKSIELNDLGKHVVRHQLRPKVSKVETKKYPKELIRLMKNCWKQRPKERPEIAEVVNVLKKLLSRN